MHLVAPNLHNWGYVSVKHTEISKGKTTNVHTDVYINISEINYNSLGGFNS